MSKKPDSHNSKTRTSNSKILMPHLPEPKSAQQLCDQLQEMVQMKEWNKSWADHFINLVVNPNKQYQLDQNQRKRLISSILSCPSQYIAFVHLQILYNDFIAKTKLYTLDGISSEIIDFIRSELKLEPRIESTLLKIQGDKVLLDWIKRELQNKKNFAEKLNLVRNLVSYLIGGKETSEYSMISNRINIILDAFTGSNYSQYLIKDSSKLTLEQVTQYRVSSIVDLFSLDKPTTTESARLILFGGLINNIVKSQEEKINEIDRQLTYERTSRFQRDQMIEGLEIKCKELENELMKMKEMLVNTQNELHQEQVLYEQLETSSKTKINQQRKFVLDQVRSRIEHELQKLERCLNGEAQSFFENSQMGKEIIDDIRNRLKEIL